MVEFALVLPILLVLLLGIMDFGWLFAGYLELQNVARDEARYAAVNKITDKTVFEQRVKDRMTILDPIKVVFNYTNSELYQPNLSQAEYVEVNLGYPMKMMTPFIGSLVGDPIDLQSKMDMRVEWR